MLSSEDLDFFNLNGYLKITVPEEIRLLQTELLKEIDLYLNFYHPSLTQQPVEYKLVELAEVNREELGKLYKVVRRFPAMRKLSCSEWAISISQQLMNTNLISCCNFVAARFDLPGETKYATAPHQDFPYIQGSLDGLTFWIPFVSTKYDVGAPSFIPGSHKLGAVPVVEQGINNTNGTSSIESTEIDNWKNLDYTLIEVEINECLIMHTLLVHRSEPNTSKYARISTQIRFDNLEDNDSYKSGFSDGLYLNEPLSRSYPNLVIHT